MPTGSKPKPGRFSAEVGSIIAAAITRRGTTVSALAEQLDISRTQFSGMLNGRKHWDLDQLDRACAVLDLDPASVIEEAHRTRTDRPQLSPRASRSVAGPRYALAASDDDNWQSRQEAENE